MPQEDETVWIFTAGQPDPGMMAAVAGLTHAGQPWVIVIVADLPSFSTPDCAEGS